MGTNALVICANDSVEHVFIGGRDDAEKLMQKMSMDYFNNNKWAFDCKFDAYKKRVYWCVRSVPMTTGEDHGY